jgi:iron complex transport system substrate-binding protein
MKQKLKIFILLLIALILCLIFLAITRKQPVIIIEDFPPKSYSRIISLAPSTTEILFALGLGDNVIGVSEFCNYPTQAKTKLKLGGLLNPNYEAIVAAKPDLVIVFEEMLRPEDKFAAMGIKTLAVKHNTIRDILDSIVLIGQSCGRAERAKAMVGEIESKMQTIKSRCVNQHRPKVLIAVGHNLSQNPDKAPENIYIAGKDDFYSTMIEIADGQNAYAGNIAFPAVGYESIISMNPQIIIDIVSVEQNQIDPEIVIKQWKNFSLVDAVKNDRIYIFGENYMAIPGPRFILTLEKIACIINPELNMENDEPKSN